MKKRILSLAIAAAALPGAAHAYQPITRTYDAVRSLGMGDTRITTGLYEQNFYGNPARNTANPTWRIGLFDPTFEVSASTISNINELLGSGDTYQKIAGTAGKNNHARIEFSMPSVYWPNVGGGKWSYAFAVLTSIQGDAALLNTYDIDARALVDVGPAFSAARKLLPDDSLSVGATAHVNYRLASNQFSIFDLISGKGFSVSNAGLEGSHFDFDLGATYDLPFRPAGVIFQAGASVNNLLGGKYENLKLDLIKEAKGQAPAQPRALNFGVSARKDRIGAFKDTTVALEFTDWGNNRDGSLFRTIHLGAETRFTVLLGRVGINQGYWTAGLGLDLKFFEIEAASYGEELGLNAGAREDRRYALRLAFQI